MATYKIQDWMDARELGEEQTRREAAIISGYAASLVAGSYTLAELLRDLEPFVTEGADMISVARALALLGLVFKLMDAELTRHEVTAIVEYLCTRLQNSGDIPNFRAGILEVASCLQSLSGWKRFSSNNAETVTKALFALSLGSTFKDLKPTTRLRLFELVDYLFKTFKPSLIRDMGAESLVSGLVSMAELEKNPSCLGVIFPLYTHISQSWKLDDSEFKNIWDSFIRYFPITVGGVVNDPAVPTKEMLRELLLQCILSNDHYANEAFPRCIDMLDANADLSANTKKEVLATFAACVSSYSTETLSQWSSKIWDSLKFEIWNGESEDFIQGSLDVLHALAKSLASRPYEWAADEDPLARFVLPAVTECNGRLHDSKKQYLLPSGRILESIASSSPYAFHLVVKTALPVLNVVWQDLKLASEKTMLLSVFNNILRARVVQPEIENHPAGVQPLIPAQVQDYTEKSLPDPSEILDEFRDGLVEIYFGALSTLKPEQSSKNVLYQDLKDTSYGIPAIQGLVILFRIPNYLSAVEKVVIVKELNTISLSHPESNEIRLETLNALQLISASEPTTFRDITLPNFVENLPSQLSIHGRGQKTEMKATIALLHDLVQISCTSPCLKELEDGPPPIASTSYWHRNFDLLIVKLLDKLDAVLVQEAQLSYGNIILATICNALQVFDHTLDEARIASTEPSPLSSTIGPYTNLVETLFSKVVERKPHLSGSLATSSIWYTGIKTLPNGRNAYDDTSIQLVGRISMLALRSKLTTPSNNFLLRWNASFPDEPSAIWTLFVKGPHSIGASQQDLEFGPADKCTANILSMYLISGNQRVKGMPDIEEEKTLRIKYNEVAAAMIRNAISTENDSSKLARSCMLSILQVLVNKYPRTTKDELEGGPQSANPQTNTNPTSYTLLRVMEEALNSCSGKSDVIVGYTYQALAYFTAAAFANFDKSMLPLGNHMIEGLKNAGTSLRVAQSFRILLAPSEVMSKENGCTIRALRQAKVINHFFPTFASSAKGNVGEQKENYLIALAGLLEFTTPSLVADMATNEVFLAILEGTNIKNDDWAKLSCIKMLLALIPLLSSKVEEYLDTVIRLMTDRTSNTYDSKSDSAVKCRSFALDVLSSLTEHVETNVLMKRRAKLLVELDAALDDCSREVRGKAQGAKMRWLYLDESA